MLSAQEAREKTNAVISANRNKTVPKELWDLVEQEILSAIKFSHYQVYICISSEQAAEYSEALIYQLSSQGYSVQCDYSKLFVSWSPSGGGRYGD